MNKGRTFFASFCVIFTIAVAGAANADAQLYSGRATGINAAISINGNTTTETVADTCPLSSTGGSHIATTPIGIVSGVVRTGPITSTTSGAGNSSQSSSTVQDLSLTAGGYRITATSVNASSQCNCCVPTAPACGGRSTITGLLITDPAGNPVPATPNGSVNQTITLAGGAGTIVFNEQTSAPGELTVNAIHVNITGANGTNTNVIVASAHSDIDCTGTLPTAAHVIVSGRVVDSTGRGIARASVTITSGQSVRSTRTTITGAYNFADVAVGETYILEATYPGLTFAPVVVNLLDEMTSIEIRANAPRPGAK
ncbi:MAG TPA: carboxypeptidase-like regulatory domain-containing protein [Pyrinomonadaceae bacterium]|nr:carboxypeptidase-like regulatory domain-containing protein [Pyrinomonadaceae bacterium]